MSTTMPPLMRSTTLPVIVSFALNATSIFSQVRRRSTFRYDRIVKPSLCSPVRCTSIVLFGSGRGISVSVNSAAGIRPSVFPPRSTTTPCSVYATTLTSITSCDAAASCFSSYSSSSLLISSEPAASSAAAAASGSAACVSAAGFAFSDVATIGVSCPAIVASVCSVAAAGEVCSDAFSTVEFVSGCVLFGVVSASGAGAAAAALDWLSWSENMVVGLRKITSLTVAATRPRVQSNRFLAASLSGLMQGGSPQSGYLGHRCCGRRKRCNLARILAASTPCQSNLGVVLRAPGVGLFAAKIRCGNFHGAAHLIQSRPHSTPDALLQRILAGRRNQFAVRKPRRFALRGRVIQIIRRDDRRAVLVIPCVQDNTNDV